MCMRVLYLASPGNIQKYNRINPERLCTRVPYTCITCTYNLPTRKNEKKIVHGHYKVCNITCSKRLTITRWFMYSFIVSIMYTNSCSYPYRVSVFIVTGTNRQQCNIIAQTRTSASVLTLTMTCDGVYGVSAPTADRRTRYASRIPQS